ncbi:ATP-binding protein [Polyangium aurulentum]|uniref:ATP-binding protein n=1 Tax=Polyangium aurulentum TaxID=2567896 RepID=UPI0010AEAB60|nr:ATP-binding protein [Polyangium aurulentum]UQA63278.1 ATP-binding protein [Polyangium aurulentum]
MPKERGASPEPVSFDISNEHDRFWCAAEGKRYAGALGFDAKAQGEVAICIAELVSNVAKFAGCGTLMLSAISEPRLGIRIVVEDAGPGVSDPATVFEDGFSEGRRLDPGTPRRSGQGLGVGLGAVARMMSHVEMVNVPQRGLRVVALKWLEPPSYRGVGPSSGYGPSSYTPSSSSNNSGPPSGPQSGGSGPSSGPISSPIGAWGPGSSGRGRGGGSGWGGPNNG